MEHPTALVDHDATTQFTCSCQKLVAAGWRVNCSACGRREFTETAMIEEFGTLILNEAVPGPELLDAWAEDLDDDGTIEPYDVARDDALTDAA